MLLFIQQSKHKGVDRMIDKTKEFALLIQSFDCSNNDLSQIINGFSDKELAEEALMSIEAQFGIPSGNMQVIQTKRGFGE